MDTRVVDMPEIDSVEIEQLMKSEKVPRPGLIVGGHYRLIKEIGRGGMGSVWEAERTDWDVVVAVKLMSLEFSEGSESDKRFQSEIRMLAKLQDSRVVSILDSNIDPGLNRQFLVMDLLKGQTLSALLRERGTLSASEMFAIVEPVAQVLAVARREGLVHRDLKPANLFLCEVEGFAPSVKVLDFGLARLVTSSSLTQSGRIVGTPFYMSPERLTSEEASQFDVDLWSLAVIVFECMTGQLPFEAKDSTVLLTRMAAEKRIEPSSVNENIPPGLDEWFAKATDPDVGRRHQSAGEFARALAGACEVNSVAFADKPKSHAIVIRTSNTSKDNWTEGAAFASTLMAHPPVPKRRNLKRSVAVAGLALAVGVFAIGSGNSWFGESSPEAQFKGSESTTVVQGLYPKESGPKKAGRLPPESTTPTDQEQGATTKSSERAEPGTKGSTALDSERKATPDKKNASGKASVEVSPTALKAPPSVAESVPAKAVAAQKAKLSQAKASKAKIKWNRRSSTAKRVAKKKKKARRARPKAEQKRLGGGRIYHTDL